MKLIKNLKLKIKNFKILCHLHTVQKRKKEKEPTDLEKGSQRRPAEGLLQKEGAKKEKNFQYSF